MSSVRTNHNVKEVKCVDPQEDRSFLGHYLSKDSNIDTGTFRHINVN
jgi:hypothetical protein